MLTLKELRERALLSQGELAKAIGVHRQTIHYWEGGLSTPRPANQRLMVVTLKCTPEELLAAIRAAGKREEQKERPAA